MMKNLFTLFVFSSAVVATNAFTNPAADAKMPLTQTFASVEALNDVSKRDTKYGKPLNTAQYLVDLHDAKATFNFCGGMMFQLVLSDKLRAHLIEAAAKKDREQQPVVHDASMSRMFQIPDYSKNAEVDNIRLFHGREIRNVPHAKGGRGFVLQLSMNENDPEGWTDAEVAGYDGWGHDVGRTWRKGERLEEEGFSKFRKQFGPDAFALHHRFYLHFDQGNRLWLSAEDGCEGTPADGGMLKQFMSIFSYIEIDRK